MTHARMLLIAAATIMVSGCGKSEAPQVLQASAPYAISRSADGCTVYAFNPDGWRWRYFARCDAPTTTDNSFTVSERVGKVTVQRTVEDSVSAEVRPGGATPPPR